MAIVGHGVDLIETQRIERVRAAHGQRFLDRCFSPVEQAHCLGRRRAAEHLAGRFAAKEAILKALGTGLAEGIAWPEAEVRPDPASGAPRVMLHGRCAAVAAERGIARWWVSISHQRTHAMASAIAEAD